MADPIDQITPVTSNPQDLVDAALGTAPTVPPTPPSPPPTPVPTTPPIQTIPEPVVAPISSSVPMGDETPLAFATMPTPPSPTSSPTSSPTPTNSTPNVDPVQQSSYLPPSPSVPHAPVKMNVGKPKRKMGIVLGGILVMVVALGSGVWGYSRLSPNLTTKIPQIAETYTPPNGNPGDCQDAAGIDLFKDCDKANPVAENCVQGGYVSEWKCKDGQHCVAPGGRSTCTGDVSGFPGCPAPLKLSCGEFSEPGAFVSTNFRGTCGQYFPAGWAVTGAPANCQINCLCCPPEQTRVCKPTGQTYEYATAEANNYDVVCKKKEDLYISDRPNPAYNPNLPPEDQTSICEVIRQKANGGGDVWRCLKRLTTCAVAACACTGSAGMACTSLAVTPTTPPAIGTKLTFTCTGSVTPSSAGTLSYKYRYSINGGAYVSMANNSLTIAACGSYKVECQACATLNGVLKCDPTWTGATQ